jgi:hypothetical protein
MGCGCSRARSERRAAESCSPIAVLVGRTDRESALAPARDHNRLVGQCANLARRGYEYEARSVSDDRVGRTLGSCLQPAAERLGSLGKELLARLRGYSTVAAKEKQQAIAKVIQLAGVRETLAQGTSPRGGVHGPRNRKAARP